MRTLTVAILTTALALSAAPLWLSAGQAQQTPQADNTKVNARDRQDGAATADTQKMDKADRETARRIRQLVIKDKSLSTYAHNAKIIVRDGTVTLKGPVRSDEEKDSIAKKAISVAGDSKVINQLEVAPPKK